MQEQQAGRMLFKGAFSTGNPSGGVLHAVSFQNLFGLMLSATCSSKSHSLLLISGWFYNPFNFSVKNVANTGEPPLDKCPLLLDDLWIMRCSFE